MKKYQFTYKGTTYECIGEDRDFQIFQFKSIIEQQDWVTMENRITNQTKCWGGILKEITETKRVKISFDKTNDDKYEEIPPEKIYESNNRIKKEMKEFKKTNKFW